MAHLNLTYSNSTFVFLPDREGFRSFLESVKTKCVNYKTDLVKSSFFVNCFWTFDTLIFLSTTLWFLTSRMFWGFCFLIIYLLPFTSRFVRLKFVFKHFQFNLNKFKNVKFKPSGIQPFIQLTIQIWIWISPSQIRVARIRPFWI